MNNTIPLARKLGLADAIAIGLASMIGAGVFAVFAPTAAIAGSGLLIGLLIAGCVAYLNATSSAQLAAQYPVSGGAYTYGREQLGEWPGFVAGWSFVVGKTASCAAMSLTFAAYVAPSGWEKPVAIAAVLLLTGINYFGVTRTATVAKVIVVVVLLVLALVVVAASASGGTGAADLLGGGGGDGQPAWYAVLQSAGLLFFAFAGYARIATMGEEVRSPERTIPRAIALSLGLAFVIYAVLAVVVLGALGPERLAESTAPLAEAAGQSGWEWTGPIVRIGASAAALGALLALIAGVSRTGLAMARNDDLPRWFAAVHSRYRVPHRAELALAAIVSALILVTDLRGAIGFSSFGVLLYYLIANIAAYRQQPEHRRFPRPLQIVGAIGCLLLVATLPLQSVAGGVIVLGAGVVYRVIRVKLRTP
ncbi:amino acid permease [Leucobacter coleopterorum]|uniref:Amino acid permease n=1 Tax=Leucobacter coleopterorum TaxID=2714933 RepID=A0ABX6JTI8_9MICO|nr:amino acid permease [Leucobacter coleopterorum]QIM17607.1 amino acid permease [Leucobacter coleopterorum]